MNDFEEDWPDVASTRARRQAFVDQQLGRLVRNADPLATDTDKRYRDGMNRANAMCRAIDAEAVRVGRPAEEIAMELARGAYRFEYTVGFEPDD